MTSNIREKNIRMWTFDREERIQKELILKFAEVWVSWCKVRWCKMGKKKKQQTNNKHANATNLHNIKSSKHFSSLQEKLHPDLRI